jgi:hypothetical protein
MQRILLALGFLMLLTLDVQARVFELRGIGALPLETELGVPGEGITVTVLLESDNFAYVTVPNPIFHLFETFEPIPVEIVGTSTGKFPMFRRSIVLSRSNGSKTSAAIF